MARPVITVKIAFDSNPLDSSPAWTDVSDYVDAIPSIRRGRATEVGRFEAGRATVVLENKDGRFTPGNIRSPYYDKLLPMKKIQIYAVYSAVTYYLFTGYIVAWPPTWQGGLLGTTTIECIDAFKIFSVEKIDYSRTAEESHWRLVSVLETVGWPGADTNIFTGTDVHAGKSTVAAVDLVQAPPLSHMQDVAEAEDGQIFMNGQGWFIFQGRHWRYGVEDSNTVQATFGDEWDNQTKWILGTSLLGVNTTLRPAGWVAGDLSELPFIDLVPSFDDTFIINDAQISADGGATQYAEDLDSQSKYATHTFVKDLIITSNTEAQDRATWTVLRNAEPDIRFKQLRVSGLHNDALWPHVLGREISDRVAVVKRPPGSYALRKESWIEAIEHRDIMQDDWQTLYTLSPTPDAAISGSPWILEDPVFGYIDSTNYLGY